MFRDFSRNNPTVFRAKLHQTKHIHLDDNKPSPTWWQNLLIALSIVVSWIGCNSFFNWIETPAHLAIAWKYFVIIASLGLLYLGVWYWMSFSKSRVWCQTCNPSRCDRY